ncbi:MAG: DctP family TRAP transporter solute-binding subunit [Sedimentibacter sp.]|uniref:DctP family TRAP transporter solute-binding subunit n=1 Tax=Sedimentibacter sp. TaxID=1960295 RepID=UPI0029829B2A|nr:DctP family TRAP transporter solute-binding subunit [Sedimentibacter sp.]MDW5299231.1 DctP family TRAP transporter solute-binding subunit [Sedimentibacter sp.]
MKKILSLITVAALVLSLAMTGCAAKTEQPAAEKPAAEAPAAPAEKVTLKFGTTTADTSTWTLGAKKFAEIVGEKTDGRIEVKVYPNEQLSGGNQSKGIEMLMSGSTDITFHSNIIYSVMDERFGVISLPFLISDTATADKLLGGEAGESLNKILLEKNIVGLGYGENGFRQLTNSVKSVETPADMAGMKIRIPGIKMFISLFKALGSDPITMNFGEVFTALQQGTIDGQENPTDVISSSKINEVQKYMTVWNYSYDAIILGMNKDKFESFSAEDQQILKDAAKEACDYQKQLNRDKADEQTQQFIDGGMTVNTLTPEQTELFKEAVQPVYTEYEPIMGKDLIDAFR